MLSKICIIAGFQGPQGRRAPTQGCASIVSSSPRATARIASCGPAALTGQADYVLPVKRPIRVAEALEVGDVATVAVELIDFA